MTTGEIKSELLGEEGPIDRRQSATAADIQRGVQRVLHQHGFASLTEFPLANGRRADVIGLNESGEIWIIEIKSSLEDFRADQKWPDYREFSDRLFFAVKTDFPREVLPEDTGLILADRFGGEIVRPSPEAKLAGARRKTLTLRIARIGAMRLTIATNPALAALMGPDL